MRLIPQSEIEAVEPLVGPICVVGYGNQGRAHALNLRDSGLDVVVGARQGKSAWDRALEDDFKPLQIGEAVVGAKFVMLTLPDEVLGEVYHKQIEGNLRNDCTLAVCHGFSLVYKSLVPDPKHDVILAAPKGPGRALRAAYESGNSLIGYVGVWQDVSGQAMNSAIAYAKGIGCAGRALYEIGVETETVSDLFGEQAVLCGGIPELIKAGFDTLVEAGFPPEAAYLETMHEAKLIVDLLYEGGLEKMRESISPTASFGGALVGKRVIDESVRQRMRECLDEILSGRFAEIWLNREGPEYQSAVDEIGAEKVLKVESVGRRIRDTLE